MTKKTPSGMSRDGRKLWREVTGDYELRPDEYRILEDACREADIVAMLETAMGDDGFSLIVAGSQGQPVANPLVSEVRQHRSALRQLLGQLKLPDENAAENRSAQARAAVNARWRRGA